VPSEQAFSNGALTSTRRRNRLKPSTFEALQILKGAYRNGHIKALVDAEAHVAGVWDESDDEGVNFVV
jgi:hypothetical protein